MALRGIEEYVATPGRPVALNLQKVTSRGTKSSTDCQTTHPWIDWIRGHYIRTLQALDGHVSLSKSNTEYVFGDTLYFSTVTGELSAAPPGQSV